MKKTIAAIITLVICVSLVVGCGKKKVEESVSTAPSAAINVTTGTTAETTTAETNAAVKDNKKETSKKEVTAQQETSKAAAADSPTAADNTDNVGLYDSPNSYGNDSWDAPQSQSTPEKPQSNSSNTSNTSNTSSSGNSNTGSYESMWEDSQPETSGSTYVEEPETTMPHVHFYEMTDSNYEAYSNNYEVYTCACGDSYTVDLGWHPCSHTGGASYEITGRIVCNACHVTLESKDAFIQHTIDNQLIEWELLEKDPNWRNEYGVVHGGAFTYEQAEICHVCGEILGYAPSWGIR